MFHNVAPNPLVNGGFQMIAGLVGMSFKLELENMLILKRAKWTSYVVGLQTHVQQRLASSKI